MIVQEAVFDDALEIFELLQIMHGEMGEAPINPNKVLEYVRYHIRKNRVFIVKSDQKIIGALGIELVNYWYSDAQYLVDTFFFVDPSYRKTAAATLLMEASRNTAKSLKLKLKIAVVNPERASQRLVPIHGFTPNGYVITL